MNLSSVYSFTSPLATMPCWISLILIQMQKLYINYELQFKNVIRVYDGNDSFTECYLELKVVLREMRNYYFYLYFLLTASAKTAAKIDRTQTKTYYKINFPSLYCFRFVLSVIFVSFMTIDCCKSVIFLEDSAHAENIRMHKLF